MNTEESTPSPRENTFALVFLLLGLGLLPLMFSGQSLWVDEAYNARFAGFPNFKDFLKLFLDGHYSESQMPLGMFYSWVGGQLFGTSEFALRAVNLLWGAVTVGTFFLIGKSIRLPWLPLFVAVQPFFWYYMNEARPYAMQIAGGSLLLWAVIVFVEDPRRESAWVGAFVGGAAILCASSLLGTIPFAILFAFVLYLSVTKRYIPTRHALLVLAGLGTLLGLLAAFYVWTLLKGGTGAKIWSVGLDNIAFAFYDFLGFSGLGPSRIELREGARSGKGQLARVLLEHSEMLASLVLVYLLAAVSVLLSGRIRSRLILVCAVVVGATFATMVAAALIVKFPFWARHLAGVFPFLVLLIAFSLDSWWLRFKPARVAFLAFAMLVLLLSSLNLRFNPRFAKDDYRQAAALALRAAHEGKIVWWAADNVAAAYYGLIPVYPGDAGQVFCANNRTADHLTQLPTPDVVLLSKIDLYDRYNALGGFLAENGYKSTRRFPAFSLWEK